MNLLNPLPWGNLLGRLALAIGMGAIIGMDREYSEKPAGLRTNMLVALGSALFVMAPIQSGLFSQDSSSLGRIVQGVITGVGFIGAGSILQKDRVKGLTSAAAVWISSSLGIAVGLGEWELGLIGVILAMIILRLMKVIEHQLM